jgi:hypothetical protein
MLPVSASRAANAAPDYPFRRFGPLHARPGCPIICRVQGMGLSISAVSRATWGAAMTHGPGDDVTAVDGGTAARSLSPWDILNAARSAVPAVDYALGAAGIAAAGAIVIGLLGNGRAAIIISGAMFVAMILLFAFARLVSSQNPGIIQAGIVLLWMVTIFFGIFLVFTTTAVAIDWPPAWATILGIEHPDPFNKQAMEKLLEVPKELSSPLKALANIELIRLQPRLSDLAVFAQRESVLQGGGSYYSFVSGTNEYGFSDIELEQGTADELPAFKRDAPPPQLEAPRLAAWQHFWEYKPPPDMKSVRAEGKKYRGFAVSGVTLANQVTVSRSGLYLLRSILISHSDILVGFYIVDTLKDGSVVLAWRMLNVFDTPIATGPDE